MGIGRVLFGVLLVGALLTGGVWMVLSPSDQAPEPATSTATETPVTDTPSAATATVTATATATERLGTPTPTEATPTPTQTETEVRLSIDIAHFVREEINRVREAQNLSPLNREPKLDEMARKHASNMAENQYVGHVQPDGTTLSDRYDEAGLGCQLSTGDRGGENLLRLQPDTNDEIAIAEQIVADWLDDPEAEEKLTSRFYSQQGVGVAITGDGTVYVVQDFC